MKKLSIIKSGKVVQFCNFETEEQIENFKKVLETGEAWGKPERWVRDTPLNPISEDNKKLAIDQREFLLSKEIPEYQNEDGEIIHAVPAVYATEYLLPAEYDIEIVDVSEEIAYQKEIDKRVARINFGTQIFAELAVRNVARLKAGKTTLEQILAAEEKLAKVQRYMGNSSTEIALQGLIALDIPEIPSDEKALFVSKIQQYLASEK